jgi:hypothetical protein
MHWGTPRHPMHGDQTSTAKHHKHRKNHKRSTKNARKGRYSKNKTFIATKFTQNLNKNCAKLSMINFYA